MWRFATYSLDVGSQELSLYRKVLFVAGTTYLLWWFAVYGLLPQAYNPLGSRVAVVATIFAVWAATFMHFKIQQYLRPLFIGCLWLITAHYYYLFYFNAGDVNWIIGSYITVTAIGFFLFSSRALLTYSFFVLVLSTVLVIFQPTLQSSVFLPGLITILVQANLGLRSRFDLIRERATAAALSQNVKMRDEFISLASHELKTPISVLKMQTQLIERDLKDDKLRAYSTAKIEGLTATFNRQVDRLIELVETMLDASRISSERIVLVRQEVDLPLLVRQILSALQSQEVRSGLGIETLPQINVEAVAYLKLSGDFNRIKQIVEKLLSNAVKYGEGKPVRVIVQSEGDQAVLKVVDEGLGIAPMYLDKIFERFERAVSGKNISGMGLGLYIARQNAVAHGGNISVESRLGAGSTFTVRLPLT